MAGEGSTGRKTGADAAGRGRVVRGLVDAWRFAGTDRFAGRRAATGGAGPGGIESRRFAHSGADRRPQGSRVASARAVEIDRCAGRVETGGKSFGDTLAVRKWQSRGDGG